MERTEINVITGEIKVIPLTPAEIAEINSRPVPPPPKPLTLTEKLAAAGITLDELKEALR